MPLHVQEMLLPISKSNLLSPLHTDYHFFSMNNVSVSSYCNFHVKNGKINQRSGLVNKVSHSLGSLK